MIDNWIIKDRIETARRLLDDLERFLDTEGGCDSANVIQCASLFNEAVEALNRQVAADSLAIALNIPTEYIKNEEV